MRWKPESVYDGGVPSSCAPVGGSSHRLGRRLIRTHINLAYVPRLPRLDGADAVRAYSEESIRPIRQHKETSGTALSRKRNRLRW